MSELRPNGKFLALHPNDVGTEKTSEAGIIFTDNNRPGGMIWSKVASVGAKVEEDIRDGDMVMFHLSKIRGSFAGFDFIHEEDIELVDRPE